MNIKLQNKALIVTGLAVFNSHQSPVGLDYSFFQEAMNLRKPMWHLPKEVPGPALARALGIVRDWAASTVVMWQDRKA